ncbi:MAG: glycosyltransferase [Desulfobacteraceae bacterium]|nr:glycosyltransferase [Desulfobacteraceae bacterium]
MIHFVAFAQFLLAAGLFVLIVCGGRRLRGRPQTARPAKSGKVRCIVPASGAGECLAPCIRSLLRQDYPEYEIVFVTRDAEDPAAAVIRDEIAQAPRAKLVHSGRATVCGQKNHSILRGLREPPADSEITVFGDSTRLALPDWLKNLTAPIAAGEAIVTSGYHHALPMGRSIAQIGRACSVLMLFLTKGFPFLNQPWGGATAIRTEDIERLEIPGLWARKVVDDVALAAHLKKRGIYTSLSTGAALATPIASETLAGWNEWLIRQWLYLKFCCPVSWAACGMVCDLAAALIVFSIAATLLGGMGLAAPSVALSSSLFLGLVAGLGIALRRSHPDPGPVLLWICAFFATLLLAGWSHMETLRTDHIDWKGIRYKVAWGGDVTQVRDRE